MKKNDAGNASEFFGGWPEMLLILFRIMFYLCGGRERQNHGGQNHECRRMREELGL